MSTRLSQDFVGRHHDPEIDHIKIITLEDYTHDIFANIMDISLDSCHQNLCFCLLFALFFGRSLNVGDQVGNPFFHHSGTFHNLGKEHLALSKKIPHDIHAIHHRPFNHLDRVVYLLTSLFDIVHNVLNNPFEKSMLNAL